MELHLTEPEVRILAELLETDRKDLLMQIARTDNRAMAADVALPLALVFQLLACRDEVVVCTSELLVRDLQFGDVAVQFLEGCPQRIDTPPALA